MSKIYSYEQAPGHLKELYTGYGKPLWIAEVEEGGYEQFVDWFLTVSDDHEVAWVKHPLRDDVKVSIGEYDPIG